MAAQIFYDTAPLQYNYNTENYRIIQEGKNMNIRSRIIKNLDPETMHLGSGGHDGPDRKLSLTIVVVTLQNLVALCHIILAYVGVPQKCEH